MGIESDQLVYDYLSRVGDLAQQQQLSSGARMRLVSTLRGEIDRRRTTEGADSPAAVRRIIGRLGSPDELVAAAARSGDGTVPLPSAVSGSGSGEPQRRGLPRPRSGLLRKEPREAGRAGPRADEGREATGLRKPKAGFGRGASRRDRDAGDAPEGRTGAAGGAGAAAVPRPGPAPDDVPAVDDAPGPDDAPDEDVPVRAWPDPSAPHMLGQDQQGAAGDATDWWRLEPGPFDEGTAVPGFFGGIEAPELLGRRPRPVGMDKKDAEEEGGREGAGGAKAEADEAGSGENGANTAARRRAMRLVKLRRRKP
ncbi:chromosomal replication initiator protein DnaA, partial [Streptomyces parvus]